MEQGRIATSNTPDISAYGRQRRSMLKIFGFTAASGALLTACDKDNDGPRFAANAALGSGDTGILNYAYALEQLEAAFYTQVVLTPYKDIPANEKALLIDIRDHEIAHKEFFRNALGKDAIPGLEVNFSSIDFTSRTSVLATAQAFEDLGVSAYNGAGKLISNGDYLVLAGKIVSVEARHAALIRDLVSNGTFASGPQVDAMGMDVSKTPAQVLAVAGTYIKTTIDASSLPS